MKTADLHGARWTLAQLAELLRLIQSGKTAGECAEILGRSESSVRNALHRARYAPDVPKPAAAPYYPNRPAQVIGRLDQVQPDDVARRVMTALSDMGALMLIRERDQLVGAIPGSTPAQRAEARGPKAIVGTYWIHGADRQAIAEDIREALRSAA